MLSVEVMDEEERRNIVTINTDHPKHYKKRVVDLYRYVYESFLWVTANTLGASVLNVNQYKLSFPNFSVSDLRQGAFFLTGSA